MNSSFYDQCNSIRGPWPLEPFVTPLAVESFQYEQKTAIRQERFFFKFFAERRSMARRRHAEMKARAPSAGRPDRDHSAAAMGCAKMDLKVFAYIGVWSSILPLSLSLSLSLPVSLPVSQSVS